MDSESLERDVLFEDFHQAMRFHKGCMHLNPVTELSLAFDLSFCFVEGSIAVTLRNAVLDNHFEWVRSKKPKSE